ncbi:MAG: hypothetical protein IK127_05365 [Clostridia bacterium]|nr:hypothetical protein [Clostridia bacterium]
MTMLLKQNPNTFEMSYIVSEDVQAGELRADLHQARYNRAAVRTRRERSMNERERLAEAAWERFVARQAARTEPGTLAAALRERAIA